MPKYMIAPPGTNPMEMPELIKKKRMGKIKTIGLIAGMVLLLACLCGVPAYFLTRPKTPVAASAGTATITPIYAAGQAMATRPASATATLTPTVTNTALPSSTPTPAATQTARVITVVNRQVVTYVQTVVITATPEPTYTPWIITVVVTPTATETPEVIFITVEPGITLNPRWPPREMPTVTPTPTQ